MADLVAILGHPVALLTFGILAAQEVIYRLADRRRGLPDELKELIERLYARLKPVAPAATPAE